MNEEELREQLLKADGLEDVSSAAPFLARVLEQEERFERRVRRLALICWSVVLGLLPLLGAFVYWIRSGDGDSVEIVRAMLSVAIVLGLIALPMGILFTVFWLFRSRTPTLRVIERRLATLERKLTD